MQIIKPPLPFFNTLDEGLDKDLPEIENYFKNISSKSNFLHQPFIEKKINLSKDKMMESIDMSRIVLLLYMSIQPEFTNLISANNDEFLEKTDELPLFREQDFRSIFEKMHHKPSFLAKYIRSYFKTNIYYLFIFSWLTFPSIYGFFTTSSFIEYGRNLIMEFLVSPSNDDVLICNSLLPPYFFCAFEFLSKLWSKVSYGISQIIDRRENIFDFMIDCISSCSYLLSSHHQNIIHTLYRETPNRCITFLFNSFLKISFDIFSRNDDFLFSPASIESINNFFIEGLKTTLSEKGNKIINAFTFSRNVINDTIDDISVGAPSSLDKNMQNKTSLIISTFDIGLISEIYSYSDCEEEYISICSPEFLLPKVEYKFKKGYSPMIICVTNHNKSDKEEKEEELNLPLDFTKFWNKTICNCRSDDLIIQLDYFIQEINTKIKNNSNNYQFSKLAYLKQIYELEQNYSRYSTYLKYEKNFYENECLLDSIQSFIPPLVSMHCKIVAEPRKVSVKEIGDIVLHELEIDTSGKKIDCYSFVKFCSILDSLEIELDNDRRSLNDRIMKINKDKRNSIQDKMLPHRKAKRIINKLCNRFHSALEWKSFGRQFNAILRFANDIYAVHSEIMKNSDGLSSKLDIFFIYAMCIINDSIFCDAYMIIKLILNKNKDLLPSFDKETQQKYIYFDNAMAMFLKHADSYPRCLNYIKENTII